MVIVYSHNLRHENSTAFGEFIKSDRLPWSCNQTNKNGRRR